MGLNLKDLNTIVTMKIEPKEYEYLILNLDLELEMAASSLSFECILTLDAFQYQSRLHTPSKNVLSANYLLLLH